MRRPNIYTLARQFREDVLNREVDAATELLNRYGTTFISLSKELDALTQQIIDAQAAGTRISEDWLYRSTRLQSLLQQVYKQVGSFGAYAETQVTLAQIAAIKAAQNASAQLVMAALGPLKQDRVPPTNFLKANVNAVETFSGRASNGSPLADLFNTLAPDSVAQVRDTFVKAILTGENPRTVASKIQSVLNVPKDRALVISRTEVLQTYRETQRDYFQHNKDIVTGYQWMCAKQARTCAMCIALDGRIFETEEPFGTHPNCRCALVPVTKSWAELGFEGVSSKRQTQETGAEWFERQTDATKREILGPGKLARYNAGELTLTQLVGFRDDPEWGPNRWERSLRDVDAGKHVATPQNLGILSPGKP